ncbi:MAG TPA: 50S ribosomal protein L10 [Candidatus Paceibacterota bacterium]|nr:50S ribosomal protein L10 [Candidatus Paceibacterota bacterium]HRZ99162.1 50S ribosomal protein L10 [Candidatus Paceibacterota bacterium]
MRAEKLLINKEYLARLNASPFFIVVDYQGLAVGHFTELRKRLLRVGAEIHVVKNSVFRLVVKDAGIADLAGGMTGQLAVITGKQDLAAAAKVLKTFKAEFQKPKVRFGYLGNQRLEAEELNTLADLPSLNVLRGMLAGVIQAPATHLVRVIQAPGQQLARVLQAKIDKEQQA